MIIRNIANRAEALTAGVEMLQIRADDSSTEIPWYSFFWALVQIALNSMIQPTGRVLRYPLHARVWLRASPIICVFDALASLCRLSAYLWTRSFTSSSDAVTRVLQVRMQGIEQDEFMTVESSRSVHWWCFVLGTLLQAFKLFSLGGIPLTQTWAGMYLASFFVFEALHFASKKRLSDILPLRAPSDNLRETPLAKRGDQTRLELEFDKLENRLISFDRRCSSVALILHFCLQAYVFRELSLPIVHIHGLAPILVLGLLTVFLFAGSISCLTQSFLMLLDIKSDLEEDLKDQQHMTMGTIIGIFAAPIVVLTARSLAGDIKEGAVAAMWIAVLIVVLLLVMVVGVIDAYAHSRIRDAYRSLVFGYSFIFSLTSLVFAVCYYTLRYDPVGTHQPKWTRFLG